MKLIYIFIVIIFLFSSCLVILAKNPVHSVLFLIVTFITSSLILLIFNVEFLGFLFLIIYVGAIAILFLFVVMMLSVKMQINLNLLQSLFALVFCFLAFNYLFFFFQKFFFDNSKDVFGSFLFNDWGGDYSNNLMTFGQVLYNYYLIVFLIAGIILLVAVIGAVVLTLEHKYPKKAAVSLRQLSRTKTTVKFG